MKRYPYETGETLGETPHETVLGLDALPSSHARCCSGIHSHQFNEARDLAESLAGISEEHAAQVWRLRVERLGDVGSRLRAGLQQPLHSGPGGCAGGQLRGP